MVSATRRSSLWRQRDFAVAGSRAWNSLPSLTARRLSPSRNISRLIYLVYLFIYSMNWLCKAPIVRLVASNYRPPIRRYNVVKLHYITQFLHCEKSQWLLSHLSKLSRPPHCFRGFHMWVYYPFCRESNPRRIAVITGWVVAKNLLYKFYCPCNNERCTVWPPKNGTIFCMPLIKFIKY